MREGPAGGRPDLETALWFHGGMVLLVALTFGFHLRLDVPVLDSLFVGALLGALPAASVGQLAHLAHFDMERLQAYVSSAVTILVLGSVALVLGAMGPGLEAMGLGAVAWESFAWASLAVAGAATAVTLAFFVAMKLAGVRETHLLRKLLPRTAPEKSMFAALSLAAGLGEEIVYRGYVIPVLVAAAIDPWVAAALSSAAFGLLHAYQGPVGMLRTAALGFVFAASLVVTGTLWPAILVHVLVDLVGGLWLGPRMVGVVEDVGDEHEPPGPG